MVIYPFKCVSIILQGVSTDSKQDTIIIHLLTSKNMPRKSSALLVIHSVSFKHSWWMMVQVVRNHILWPCSQGIGETAWQLSRVQTITSAVRNLVQIQFQSITTCNYKSYCVMHWNVTVNCMSIPLQLCIWSLDCPSLGILRGIFCTKKLLTVANSCFCN